MIDVNRKHNNIKNNDISSQDERFAKEFGAALRNAREKNERLQTKFKESTGLSNKSISKIEKGIVQIKAVDYIRLQRDLNFKFDETIVFNNGDKQQDSCFETKKQLANSIKDQLTDEEARLLYELIKKMKEKRN